MWEKIRIEIVIRIIGGLVTSGFALLVALYFVNRGWVISEILVPLFPNVKFEIVQETEHLVDLPTPTVSPTEAPQATNEIPTSTDLVEAPTGAPELIADVLSPLIQHYEVYAGTGVFELGTFSQGNVQYTEDWLRANGHFRIQRIRQEEYPSGCDTSRFTTDRIWISGSKGMTITVNGEEVGEYLIDDDPHGFVFEYQINYGDRLCAVNFKNIGFMIVLGDDIYYHYDSYCYRGHC